jgi:membrane protease YdiL (CAAX protease family)
MREVQTQAGSPGLVPFLFLSYLVAWTAFITVALWVPAQTAAGYALVLFGAYSPGGIALLVTARSAGRREVAALLRRILKADVPIRLYILALTYMAAVKVAAAILHRLVTGDWPPFGDGSLALIPLAIVVSTPFQAGEEIGWRGYALPRLADRFGLRIASVLLGIIWAAWHLPQFYIAGADTYHQSFVVWALQVIALSVAFAWLYAKSGGSLLLVMLLHSAINNSKDIVPSGAVVPPGVFSPNAPLMAWLTVGLLWMAAGYFLIRMPARGDSGGGSGSGANHGLKPGRSHSFLRTGLNAGTDLHGYSGLHEPPLDRTEVASITATFAAGSGSRPFIGAPETVVRPTWTPLSSRSARRTMPTTSTKRPLFFLTSSITGFLPARRKTRSPTHGPL